MHAILNRRRRMLQIAAAMFPLVTFAGAAQADIFQWEYINPADPSQGKRQSTTLAPGGAGIDAVPGADLSSRNLTMAYLIGANLTNANAFGANLTDTDLTQTNLNNAYFLGANLTGAIFREADLSHADLSDYRDTIGFYHRAATLSGADFTGANVGGAKFTKYFSAGSGITLAQLYSTASYQAHDLTGIGLGGNDLTGGNFAGQNLINAVLGTVTSADFTGAEIRGANFGSTITVAQLYSTASYRANDLSGIRFDYSNLAGANFAGQNLTNANFYHATLTGAEFTGAKVRGTSFSADGTGLTTAQLYSTESYQSRDLTGIILEYNNLSGWSFAGQNLTIARFGRAILTEGDFTEANLNNANFSGATLIDADFTNSDVLGANFATGGYCSQFGCDPGGTGITPAQLYSTASYQARNLSGINFGSNDLSGSKFAVQNLANADFVRADLTGAKFREANLSKASFVGAVLTDADFAGADVLGANLGKDRSCGTFGCFLSAGTGITPAQLYATASYQAHDLTGVGLAGDDLSGANFADQNLSNVNFNGASLTDADFTGADITGAYFGKHRPNPSSYVVGTGITVAQLYSTASYQAHDLSGISISYNNLDGANLADQNLTNATFYGATLTDANFAAADARGAYLDVPASAITTNLIRPDGRINGLDLDGSGLLVVRDYDGNYSGPIPITVDQHSAIGLDGALRMVFEADAWDSTISFAHGIPVTLGGALELTFAADVNLASQVGRTLDLFDWIGVNPTGTFAVFSPYAWDLSNLYTTGEVTLTAVPEPTSLLLAAMAAAGWFWRRRRAR